LTEPLEVTSTVTLSPCEVEFRQTLLVTASLRDTYEHEVAKATAQLRRRNLRRQDLPERLLIELAESADLQYDAILTLLMNPLAAEAVRTNLRSLLESIAQVAFVLAKDAKRPVGTKHQRSICLSLSRARELEELYEDAYREKKSGKLSLTRARKTRALYESMHAAAGCPWQADPAAWPCRRRGGMHAKLPATERCAHQQNWPCRHRGNKPVLPHQLTRVTLEGLERRIWPRQKKRRSLLAMYTTGSVFAHSSLLAAVLQTTPAGLSTRAASSFADRYGWLFTAALLYGFFLRWLLAEHPQGDVRPLMAWELGFRRLPGVRDMLAGTLAQRCA